MFRIGEGYYYGLWLEEVDNEWFPSKWRYDGSYHNDPNVATMLDLVDLNGVRIRI